MLLLSAGKHSWEIGVAANRTMDSQIIPLYNERNAGFIDSALTSDAFIDRGSPSRIPHSHGGSQYLWRLTTFGFAHNEGLSRDCENDDLGLTS